MIVESYEDVIILTGALRSNFWETIHTAVSLTLKRHPTGVIIDGSGITEITPAGAETFRDAIEFIESHDQARIVVASVPPHALEVLMSVPEVRSQLPIAATVEAARKSLDLLVTSDEEPKKKKKDMGDGEIKRTILAILSADDSDDDLLQLIKEHVDNVHGRVVLLFPIVIPRNLPLQAPMPELEDKGLKTIEKCKARLSELKTPHEVRVEHTRDLPAIIHETAEEVDAARVLVAFSRRNPEQMEAGMSKLLSIMQRVKRPIVLIRGQRDS